MENNKTNKEAPLLPYIYKSENEQKLTGWLKFFLILAGIGILFTAINFIRGFNVNSYNLGMGQTVIVIGSIVDILFICGLVSFGVYMIYSFIKRNPNAPTYGIIYCTLLFSSNIVQFFAAYLAEDTYVADNASNLSSSFGALFWNFVWILYLSLSEKVNDLFPKKRRKMPDFVIFWITLTVLFPVLWFLFVMLAGIFMNPVV